MKPTHNGRRKWQKDGVKQVDHAGDPRRDAVAHLKQMMLNEYAGSAAEHERVLRLALNEAEAVAWQTDYPHLLFSVLAAEKARAVVTWHNRQRSLRRNLGERAFAE